MRLFIPTIFAYYACQFEQQEIIPLFSPLIKCVKRGCVVYFTNLIEGFINLFPKVLGGFLSVKSS